MAKRENSVLLDDLLEVSVANFYCYDQKSGLEYYSGTLESHELSASAETEEIKGGQGNNVIASIDKAKELTLKIVDVVARQDIEALKLGGEIKTVSSDLVDAFHMPKNYVVSGASSSKSITLDATPKSGEEVLIYNNKTKKAITSENLSISGNKVTISDESIQAGDTVFVTGFKYAASATDKYSEISSTAFAPTLMCVIEVPLFNTDMAIVATKQYIFPRAKMDSAVSISGQSEKTKNTRETSLKILKDPAVDYLGRVIYKYEDME
ncbi:hypothetical protein [Clostridium sp.]|uniref:hypothetical protein n=1 Tax=Clostridium sp. TaxID=1506 RepID=UPI001B7C3E0B|nr:hypothetical protein [Clostridium sp.]MBP3914757.1 hypothetical protein [Clostridium sp.]